MNRFFNYAILLGILCMISSSSYSQASLIKDLFPGKDSSNPSELTNVRGTLFFRAFDSTNGEELWKSNGTAEGTVLVKDIFPGKEAGNPSLLTNVNGTLFFRADDGNVGNGLWKSDGTAEGTVLVKDVIPQGSSLVANNIALIKNTLFFRADDGINGSELWKSDGTEEGTVMVKDINLGELDSNPSEFTYVRGLLFFRAYDGGVGDGLWKSSGTEEGTLLIKDINPDALESDLSEFTNVNEFLYFSADDGIHGSELWKSDGTAAGTVLVKDIIPGVDNSHPTSLTNVNGTLFFMALDNTNGEEMQKLWKSDGTAEGTVPLNAIHIKVPPPFDNLYAVEDILYFTASSDAEGLELWRTDGTEAGTFLAADINPGPGSSNPSQFENIGPTLYFQATEDLNGAELWKFNPPVCTNPEPAFSTADACFGEGITFIDNTTEVKEEATYLWDFGDGISSATAGDVTHTYTEAGEYTVILTIHQSECSASISQKVMVYSLPDVTLPPFEKTCPGSPPFSLSGGLPEGGLYSGDFVSNGQFDPAASGMGSFLITYTFTDTSGCENSVTQTLLVEDEIPPQITEMENIVVGNDPGICGASIVLEPPLTSDNCGVQDIENDAPAVFDVGTTIVTWTVTDVNGNKNTATQTIEVTNNIPLLGDIEAMPDSIPIGTSLNMNIAFTDNNLEDAQWEWGDDNFSAGQISADSISGSHIYDTSAVYTPTVTVTDACGEQQKAVFQPVVVYDPEGLITGIETEDHTKISSQKIKMYPNPVFDHTLHIEYDADRQEMSVIKIFDTSGKVDIEQKVSIGSGINFIDIDTSLLSRGQYIVYFEAGETLVARKFIK